MAGNRQVFEQAMRQGTNYAWDRQWDKAIIEYRRALAEFPNDPSVYTALAQALVYADRKRDALEVYQRVARLTPEDPTAFSRVAELQEDLGDDAGAVRTWLHAADVHLKTRAVDSAIQVWEHVIEVAPDNVAARERLAKAYSGMEYSRKAIRHYLALATIFQQRGDTEQATAVAQTALKLDPRHPDVLSAIEALQQGRSIEDLASDTPEGLPYAAFEATSDEERETGSLVEMTRQQALTELADALLEDTGIGDLELTALLAQGIDFQTRGELERAVACYEKALAGGIQNPAARFNLGLLYQETLQFEDAIGQFQALVADSDYAWGARFALGECLRALGRLDEAVAHFVEVLKQIDLSTVGPEGAQVLQKSYESLARRYADPRRDTAVAGFVNALVEFLGSERWEERVLQAREQLNRVGGERVISLAEILTLPESERILASMDRSQAYLEQGFLRSASEECLWAIQRAPEYLPLHLHLAQLFTQGNQVERAMGKYLAVANTLAARDEIDQAKGLFERVLRMAPMDLDVRHTLIRILDENDRIEPALEHRLALADAYYELAQIESAREQFESALRLASRLSDSKAWTARILHRLGDIDLQRLDWRSAIKVYSKLKSAVPEDEKARRRLIDLYFNLQRRNDAVRELDELIGLFRSKDDLSGALKIMDELIETRSEELELYKRAAQLSVESGAKERAIHHLDSMGELQLQMGQVQEAVATIKAIIALGPKNVDAYRQLLAQIE